MRLSLVKATKVFAVLVFVYSSSFVIFKYTINLSNKNADKSLKTFQHGVEPALSSAQSDEKLIFRQQRSAKSLPDNPVKYESKQDQRQRRDADREDDLRRTEIDDVFISVKTTEENHETRMKLLLETWISLVKYQVVYLIPALTQIGEVS